MQPPPSPPGPDESRAPKILAVTWTLYILVIAVFGLRIYTRLRPLRSIRSIGWDDITMTVAFLLLTVQMGLLVPRIKNGFGRHNYYVPAENRKTATRLLIIAQLMWALALAMCKMSVAILLLRLKQGRRWKIFLYLLVSLVLAATIITYISAFFQCRPIAARWDPTILGAKCWMPKYVQARYFAVNIFNIVTDVIFSVLPVTFIRQLNRPLREKIVLYFLMGLALFGSATSILKTTLVNNFTNNDDSLWVGVDITMWCFLEQQLGIIASCLPYLKSTFERVLTHFGLLPSLPITTPSFVIEYKDHSRKHIGTNTPSCKWHQYTRHESVSEGKSEENVLPSKPAELTSEEFLKMPERTIERQMIVQDSWDMDITPGVAV